MTYRAWEYQDIYAIAALEKECFAQERWTFQMFASSFQQNGFFGELCETDGVEGKELVGYGCVQYVLEDADLLNIAVAPAHRKKGVGRTLLKRLTSGAKRRGVEKFFLEVRASNAAAQALYKSEGFHTVATRSKYYPDGEDALVMVKML